jgi:hypothetical protein
MAANVPLCPFADERTQIGTAYGKKKCRESTEGGIAASKGGWKKAAEEKDRKGNAGRCPEISLSTLPEAAPSEAGFRTYTRPATDVRRAFPHRLAKA